jgi:hypothetical protein
MAGYFLSQHVIAGAIALYLFLYIIVVWQKPNFLFEPDGSLRQFGLGTRRRTVIPVWLLAIVLALLSYFVMMYYHLA